MNNEDVLRKVRNLLAKAERTDNPHEAEAFSAKAEEMIARYAVDTALLEAQQDKGKPTMRVYPIPAGYSKAKAFLLTAIAENHSCKMIRSLAEKTFTVVGYQSDLDLVDMLYTSLLLQATHSVQHAPRSDKTFRTSFWYGFAVRTDERLKEIRAKVAEDNEVSTALVLRDRKADVEEAFAKAFPDTRKVGGARAGSAAGFGAGKSAANRADLGQSRFGGSRTALR